jgi:histidine ammonia-lyase
MTDFRYGEDRLTPALCDAFLNGRVRAVLSPATRDRIRQSQARVEGIAAGGEVVYGINTGFGFLCNTRIGKVELNQLQLNILKSHSVGVGEPMDPALVRLMLLLKVQSLSYGHSGVSMAVMDRLTDMIDAGLTPWVPRQGSVGASGDLAPLAHACLPLIGLGAFWDGRIKRPAADVLAERGWEPLSLGPKEGLALINGTQFIAAYAVHNLIRFHRLLDHADIAGAMSLEGILGSASPFDADLHTLRPYDGTRHVAARIRAMLDGSEMVASHLHCDRVQDPYSFRCMPQVHGASRNAWVHLKELVMVEINSVTDNPVIFDHKVVSGGNFHGQPLAMALDYNALAASEIGSISDRRIYQLLDGEPFGLPTSLMRNTGTNSGFMMPQYTSAALVSENKTLCYPASADSIPTSLGQEDHVSMGSISGRKLSGVLDNLHQILSIELLCAAQAFDYRRPLKSGAQLDACHEIIRSRIDHAEEDRIFSDDIGIMSGLVSEGALLTESWPTEWDGPFSLM